MSRRLLACSPRARLEIGRARLASLAERLAPRLLAREAHIGRERLQTLFSRLSAVAQTRTHRRRDALTRLATLLEAYSYQGVLKRGFALVRDGGDRPVRDVETARAAGLLDIQFADGRVRVRSEDGPPAPPSRPAMRRTRPGTDVPQKGLFD